MHRSIQLADNIFRSPKTPVSGPASAMTRAIDYRLLAAIHCSRHSLAALYGVPTKVFNQAIRRNATRFPSDFLLQLTESEAASLRSQIVTLKAGRGRHRKYAPMAFTEHGAIMASSSALAHRLESLERSVAALDANTRDEFVRVYKAILKLMGPASPEQ